MYEYDDEESGCSRQGRFGGRRGGFRALFPSQEPAQVHPAAAVRDAGLAAVFPARLSGANRVAAGVACAAGDSGPYPSASLFDPLLRREAASKKNGCSRLLDATLKAARKRRIIGPSHRRAAIDSTGLESRHVSVYYTRRSKRHKGHLKHRFVKLSALCDTRSHLILSAVVDRGPKPDYAEFTPAVAQGLCRHRFKTLLADAGYESEANHVYCREELNLVSIIPTTSRGRPRKDGLASPVTGRYRKQMHEDFPQKTYGQRWQIETVFSMIKRNLSSALAARRPFAVNREVLLKVITHNLMIIRRLYNIFSTEQYCPLFRATLACGRVCVV